MAFQIKNRVAPTSGPSNPGYAIIQQWTQVSRGALALPQTASEVLFRIKGGRVLVHLLLGEVTTVIEATDPVLSVSAQRLNAAGTALIGTLDELAATLNLSSDEVGSMYVVEGDGTALVSTQLAAWANVNTRTWIAPPGEIFITTGASKTGAMKWDLWYQPLDAGAYVTAVSVATAPVS